MTKRFDFEDKLMRVWGTKEDIELVTRRVCDSDDWTDDDIVNILIGISSMHDAKCQELWELFNDMIKSGDIK